MFCYNCVNVTGNKEFELQNSTVKSYTLKNVEFDFTPYISHKRALRTVLSLAD